MSGDIASSERAKTDLKNKVDQLQNFETKLGLPKINMDIDECDVLTITGKDIAMMTPEECGSKAVDVSTYGFYIQRVLSKENAILKWLDRKISLAIASDLNSYEGYYSHTQRRDVAIVNNEYAKTLESLRINSEFKVDLLNGLTFQINQIYRSLIEAQTTKRNVRA